MEKDCDDPTLCVFCSNRNMWPKCIYSEVKYRGYHSILKDNKMYDIVECSNYEPLSDEEIGKLSTIEMIEASPKWQQEISEGMKESWDECEDWK